MVNSKLTKLTSPLFNGGHDGRTIFFERVGGGGWASFWGWIFPYLLAVRDPFWWAIVEQEAGVCLSDIVQPAPPPPSLKIIVRPL